MECGSTAGGTLKEASLRGHAVHVSPATVEDCQVYFLTSNVLHYFLSPINALKSALYLCGLISQDREA